MVMIAIHSHIFGIEGLGFITAFISFLISGSMMKKMIGKMDNIEEKEIKLINILQKDPELLNKVMVELRKRKINQIKNKI